MDPGITDIASHLALTIPTGSADPEQAKQDWRATIYNAKSTASIRPLTEMIERSAPGNDGVKQLCDVLRKKKSS